MKLKIEEKLEIEDGKHEGVIIGVEYRDDPYDYTDVIIEFPVKDRKLKLRAGYPTTVVEGSKLYKLLKRFGAVLQVGLQIDPDDVLIGKKCSFVTVTKESKKGTFVNIVTDSVKPI